MVRPGHGSLANARLAIGCILLLFIICGCGTPIVRHPVPAALRNEARVPGMPPGIRGWGDQLSTEFHRSLVQSFAQARAAYGDAPPTDILALSGGGAGGAFGAGLLCGWTLKGDRPNFRLVTGISTGAIIAPFAFLGPAYDRQLRDLSTTISRDDIFQLKSLFAFLGSDSLNSTEPLKHLLKRYYDRQLLKAIAAEHAKGRRLYVATTDLDAQRPVIWDMGAIAASGAAGAPDLFRQVILASASIPAWFPPVYLPVEARGKRYDEMHVDGGTVNQVTLYGEAVSVQQAGRALRVPEPGGNNNNNGGGGGGGRPPRVFVILNAKIAPEPRSVLPRLTDIADRSIATLTKSQGIGDLYRIRAVSQRDGLEFNFAYIPDDFPARPEALEVFDRAVMTRLFDRARAMGQAGYAWHKEPPGLVDRVRAEGE